jgi:deoxyribonuclease IV
MMPLFGAHMSIAGGYHHAVLEARRAGCDVVQLFTKNNNQWRAKPIGEAEEALFAEALAAQKITHPIAHTSYLLNLASPDEVLRQKSIDGMVVELQRAEQLGIAHVVVHPGAHTTCCEEDGIALVADSINDVHRRVPRVKARVTLELTAGQGTCLGCTLEQLAAMIEQVRRKDRVMICVDTCHAFAAGVDLRERKVYLDFWRRFDALLGMDRLVAVHVNDSKRELGSRVDRHEHIGRGQMGLVAFRHLVKDKRLARVPMYLETPKGPNGEETWDETNLRTLRELAKG